MQSETKWPADAATWILPCDESGRPIWYDHDMTRTEELWIIDGDGGTNIHCWFGKHLRPSDAERAETEALAQLYVTAPRLYAALEALADAFPADPVGYIDPARVEASAALSAARGEVPDAG